MARRSTESVDSHATLALAASTAHDR